MWVGFGGAKCSLAEVVATLPPSTAPAPSHQVQDPLAGPCSSACSHVVARGRAIQTHCILARTLNWEQSGGTHHLLGLILEEGEGGILGEGSMDTSQRDQHRQQKLGLHL